MSFRRRLIVSVLLIMVVPVAAIGLLLLQLSAESRTGKADARLAGALPAALSDYRADLRASRAGAMAAARDPALALAVPRDPRILDLQLRQAALRDGLTRLDLRSAEGKVLASFERADPVASASVRVRFADGGVGTVIASSTTAAEFLAAVARNTGLDAVLGRDRVIATSPGLPPDSIDLGRDSPRSEDITFGDREFRARVISLPDAEGALRLALLGPPGANVLSSEQLLIGGLLIVFVLIALALIVPLLRDLERLHEKVAEQAVTDELTGVPNHRRFWQVMTNEVERARRFDHPLSVVLVDLDDFKLVNDTYGHLQGDDVLREVARRIASECRTVDVPARYGGEEFAVVLPETDSRGAREVGERVRRRIEATPIGFGEAGESLRMTASVGIAGTPEGPLEAHLLVEQADKALYRAKQSGKNRTWVSSGEDAMQPATG